MDIYAYSSRGYEGILVKAETDLRRGLPGADIIGLPGSAVKEAKERARVAIKNSGFAFPKDRLLINLTPAGIKKEGASFDLAIALAVLAGSGQIEGGASQPGLPVLALGELELSGQVRPINGALAAIGCALEQNFSHFIVAQENAREALAIAPDRCWLVSNLSQAAQAFSELAQGGRPPAASHTIENLAPPRLHAVDFKDIKGQPASKRALEVAAAGRCNIFFFGPPGCGKTMLCNALPSILPDLSPQESLQTSRIYSIKSKLEQGIIKQAPFRAPHHSASSEGIVGGGKAALPGELSLAHNGALFLDEAPEFGKELLQNLREPLESKRVVLARAGISLWYPADFQLVMAANVCPCGALGRADKACSCSPADISRYWKRIGGALLDRIDIRIPTKPAALAHLLTGEEEDSAAVRQRVCQAIEIQNKRFAGCSFKRNSAIPASHIKEFCFLSERAEKAFLTACQKLSLSSRASHSILRTARTIADLDGAQAIEPEHALEAASYRRYGDNDIFWAEI